MRACLLHCDKAIRNTDLTEEGIPRPPIFKRTVCLVHSSFCYCGPHFVVILVIIA